MAGTYCSICTRLFCYIRPPPLRREPNCIIILKFENNDKSSSRPFNVNQNLTVLRVSHGPPECAVVNLTHFPERWKIRKKNHLYIVYCSAKVYPSYGATTTGRIQVRFFRPLRPCPCSLAQRNCILHLITYNNCLRLFIF